MISAMCVVSHQAQYTEISIFFIFIYLAFKLKKHTDLVSEVA